MLLSIALIFTIGLILGEIFYKVKLPGFIGMILTGIVLGPYVLDVLDVSLLNVSGDLRKIALVVILLRAGLTLNLSDLKKIGRPAVLMSFIPAILEIALVVIFAPIFFDIPVLEAAILGSVLAAVSPAVIVPKMIQMIEEKKGEEKRIPHLILASASVDDIFVIVLFTVFMGIYTTGTVAVGSFARIPFSIIDGIIIGVVIGFLLTKFFAIFRVRDTVKVMIMLAVSIYLLVFEENINTIIPFSALLSIMVIGITFLNQSEERALRLQVKFNKVWVFAELLLFVLVGAAVNLEVAFNAGFFVFVLLFIGLSFRGIGVLLSLIKTQFNMNEKLFIAISYIPKATVQAAIGAIPKAMGVPSGDLILALAVVSILITAPIGAILIDRTSSRLLED